MTKSFSAQGLAAILATLLVILPVATAAPQSQQPTPSKQTPPTTQAPSAPQTQSDEPTQKTEAPGAANREPERKAWQQSRRKRHRQSQRRQRPELLFARTRNRAG